MKYILSIAILFGLLGTSNLHAQSVEIYDTDNDGLSDQAEVQIYHTDPNITDTDGDGYADGVEIQNLYSPHQANKKLNEVDTDVDGLNDGWELKLGTNLGNKDTDSDGFTDGQEVEISFSPLSPDKKVIEKKITVDIKDFNLNYYFGNVLLESVKVSTGLKHWPTPKGNFKLLDKQPSKDYGGSPFSFYYPDTKWNLHFTDRNRLRYFIHGAYWHDEFGKKNVSSGCVNVAYKDMEPLYNFASVGTKIEIK